MAPGGWGIFQVPQDMNRLETFEDATVTDVEERKRLFGQYDHVRVYGKDYFEILKAAGFEVVAVDYTSKLGEEAVERYRLAKGERIPLVRKPLTS
jgi:hypothetical protein